VLAVYAAATGGSDPLANLAIGEQPAPEPQAGWAVVNVRAASLNHHDLWTLRGVSSRPVIPPQILGCDAAGTVAAYGDGGGEGLPEVGARVVVHSPVSCGRCAACLRGEPERCRSPAMLSEPPLAGTLAEQVAVPAANVVPLPASIAFETAACLPTAYLTAYHALFVRARLLPGMSVLVHGAGGGLASAAILLGRLFGLTVYATSRDERKRQFALELGAAAAHPPERETARAVITDTGGIGVDAVLESVGEPTWDLSLRAVRPGGAVVVCGATGGPNPPAQLQRIFFRNVDVLGSTMGTRAELQRLVDLCAAGSLKPVIGSRHRLADAAAAFAEMQRGELNGKIIIEV
jgi:NADPH:quinone reductase-like Zn-dependent oxidoreductase